MTADEVVISYTLRVEIAGLPEPRFFYVEKKVWDGLQARLREGFGADQSPFYCFSTTDRSEVILRMSAIIVCSCCFDAGVVEKADNEEEDLRSITVALKGRPTLMEFGAGSPERMRQIIEDAEEGMSDDFIRVLDEDGEELFIQTDALQFMQVPTWWLTQD